jgi:hypothetical protein
MKTINNNNKFIVHPDDVDVRGWDLVVEDVYVGSVNDLILHDDQSRVKYLDVLRKDERSSTDYHYLVPLSEVHFDRQNHYVFVKGNSHQFINTYPRFSGRIPSDYENKIKMYYSDSNREHSVKAHKTHESRPFDEERSYEDRNYEERYERDEIRISENSKRSDYDETDSDNWEERVNTLEKQKEIKKLEFERDMALIDKEILQLKTRHHK